MANYTEASDGTVRTKTETLLDKTIVKLRNQCDLATRLTNDVKAIADRLTGSEPPVGETEQDPMNTTYPGGALSELEVATRVLTDQMVDLDTTLDRLRAL